MNQLKSTGTIETVLDPDIPPKIDFSKYFTTITKIKILNSNKNKKIQINVLI